MTVHFIFYVANQQRSSQFYAAVFNRAADLDAPGMTEFRLGEGVVLGLMPVAGIRRLLGDKLPDPTSANDAPRAELYVKTEDPEGHHRRALQAGARELSPFDHRSWGDWAAYSLDPDGHVLAFAKPT